MSENVLEKKIYTPKAPRKTFVCNNCYQLFYEVAFIRGDKQPDVGPRFNGTTILHCRYVPGFSEKVFHCYNGLSPVPLCQGLVSGQWSNFHTKQQIPCPDGKSEYEQGQCTLRIMYPSNNLYQESPIVFILLRFIIDRMTRVAPQNDGIPQLNRRGGEYLPMPELNKKDIMIGGSFALYIFQTVFEKDVSVFADRWEYNDVDMFFIGPTSANRFKIRSVLLQYTLGSVVANDWVATFNPPVGHGRIPKMDFVRTQCDSIDEFIQSIDISVTGMVIVHTTAKIPDGMIEIGEVPYLSSDEDKWILICTPKSLEDIKAKQQTYYRKMDHRLYSKCLRRVAKYFDRGFRKIVHEPKDLKYAIGGYEDI